MKAKSNQPFPVTAFGGLEFVRYEWRNVPAGMEEAALSNPYLTCTAWTPPTPVDEADPTDPAPILATDAAIALAITNHINLAAVQGSGADGRIVVGDVRALVANDEEE
jgi:pyruvate/2-oxoglutarate dehydrogenase complex dihydrolipoamide acyltransferase (E2) component